MSNTRLSSVTPQRAEAESIVPETPSRSLLMQVMRLHARKTRRIKTDMDDLAAQVRQRQEHMRLLSDTIAEINHLTDDQNLLHIGQAPELQDKLNTLKGLGVKMIDGKLSFSSDERNRLIDNLHTASANWEHENRTQTQKMEMLLKAYDRLIMLMKEAQKSEDRAKRGATTGIRG